MPVDMYYKNIEIGDVVSFDDNMGVGDPIIRTGVVFDFDFGDGIHVTKIKGLNVYRRVHAKHAVKLSDAEAMLWKLENS
jgi:hypothetical protein